MEGILVSKLNIRTLNLTGSEIETNLTGYNCDIRNDSIDTVYAAGEPGIVAGNDGVMAIPAGQAVKLIGCNGKVCLLGTGSVQLCGNDYSELVFNTAATSSDDGGTEDKEARKEIAAHILDTGIHHTINDIADVAINPNLLDNPDFTINQRSVSGEISTPGYFVDRWQLVSGSVIVNPNGTLTLNGEIKQTLEKAAGSVTAASASSGTARYDDPTQTFYISANGDTIAWAKLECGTIATKFSPPAASAELAKCQRYALKIINGVQATVYRILTDGISFFYPLPCTLREQPKSTASFNVYTQNNIKQDGFSFQFFLKPNGIIIEATKQNHGISHSDNPILVCDSAGIFNSEII